MACMGDMIRSPVSMVDSWVSRHGLRDGHEDHSGSCAELKKLSTGLGVRIVCEKKSKEKKRSMRSIYKRLSVLILL